MKDLTSATPDQLKNFFDSFDYVLCDVDGVLWNVLEEIPGSRDAINLLKKIGKKVVLVSNNTTTSLEDYSQKLKKRGFEIEQDEIVTPILVTTSYLKEHQIEKGIFAISTRPMKGAFKAHNLEIVQSDVQSIENLDGFVRTAMSPDDEIKCVIADIDLNVNYVDLQKAATYLENPDVVFLKGVTDCEFPIGLNRIMIGPGVFIKILEEKSGRKGIPMAKPSPFMLKFIVDKYKLDSDRVLFIGDSVLADMCFASMGNFKKLLVLSGLTKSEEILKWNFPMEFQPDFYAGSLREVYDCIKKVYGQNL